MHPLCHRACGRGLGFGWSGQRRLSPGDCTFLLNAQIHRLALVARRRPRQPAINRTPPVAPLSLPAEGVAQSRLRKRAARSRRCMPEQRCGTTLRRTARPRGTRWPISEPTLRSDPAASPGVYATATARRREAIDVLIAAAVKAGDEPSLVG